MTKFDSAFNEDNHSFVYKSWSMGEWSDGKFTTKNMVLLIVFSSVGAFIVISGIVFLLGWYINRKKRSNKILLKLDPTDLFGREIHV